jgi:CSLREA domain-containing protein
LELLESRLPLATFFINSTADQTDINPGNGICETQAGNGVCTLRAAITEANALANVGGPDQISFNVPATEPGHLYFQNDFNPGHTDGAFGTTTEPNDANIAGIDPDYPYSWYRISPATALPAITQPIIIDGYTQGSSTQSVGDDALPNTNTVSQGRLNTRLRIELYGAGAPFGSNGLVLGAGSSGSTIAGLSVVNFRGDNTVPSAGIEVQSDSNHVQGNYVGLAINGTLRGLRNDHGIEVRGANNSIGGQTAAARNFVSDNTGVGIFINSSTGGNFVEGNIVEQNFLDGISVFNSPNNTIGGANINARNLSANNFDSGIALSSFPTVGVTTGNIVQGNFVGTDVTGTLRRANGDQGIVLFRATGNTIGGSAAGAGNLFFGNTFHGIYLLDTSDGNTIQGNISSMNGQAGITLDTSDNNLVQGNIFGTSAAGTLDQGNGFAGVLIINGSSGNTIGGSQASANILAFNKNGVLITDTSTGNRILTNSIYSNDSLGIDLSVALGANATGDGVTANDANDADGDPNKRQNFPVIASAGLGGKLNISYSIDSAAPNSTFPLAVEFFIADTDGQEGRTFIGSDTYNTLDGQKSITITPLATVSPGQRIVATATDAGGNTSEFSASVVVGGVVLPNIFTVNSTGDAADINVSDGVCNTGNLVAGQPECTLRAAIAQANATANVASNLPDQIQFAIPPSDSRHVYYHNDNIAGQVTFANISTTTATADNTIADIDPNWPHSWWTIQPGSALPAVTQAVVIDGTSQAGASANTNPVGQPLNAIQRIEIDGQMANDVEAGLLQISSGATTVRGLVMNRIDGVGFALDTAGANKIEDIILSYDISGTRQRPYERPPGGARIITRAGLRILSADNTIGGETPAQRNLLSDVLIGYMFLATGADRNIVSGNVIGSNGALGAVDLRGGVTIENGGGNMIGGATAAAANLIAANTAGAGVTLQGESNSVIGNTITQDAVGVLVVSGAGHLISRNSIFANTSLGIDLINGVELESINLPQDDDDADAGPNNLQNFPAITSITATAGSTTVNGVLSSRPSSTYRLEFYASTDRDPSGFGEGQIYLGSLDKTTDADGVLTFAASLPAAPAGSNYISVTATDITVRAPATTPANDTSEFSGAFPIAGCSLTVTNTADAGFGSLREAIYCANMLPGTNTIGFAIPGAGPHLIQPASELPPIIDPVVIDGYTQGSATPGDTTDDAKQNTNPAPQPLNTVIKIQLDGTNADEPLPGGGTFSASGLRIYAGNSRVQGLSITNFSDSGLSLETPDGVVFYGGNTVAGNYLGVTPGGVKAGNETGVFVDQTKNNTIGGTSPADRNLISANHNYGVETDGGKGGGRADGTVIRGNVIGSDATLTQDRGNFTGILAQDSITRIDQNVIAFNVVGVGLHAQTISRPNAKDIAILGNSIFSNIHLGIDLGEDDVSLNDSSVPPDQDGGPNNLQNFPQLTSVVTSATTIVNGTLSSTPSTSYRIEFFSNTNADPTGYGEGETFLGFVNVATDANGTAVIVFDAGKVVPDQLTITATATRLDAALNPIETSEFSRRIGGTQCSTVVTNTSDAGAGSFREAILCSNLSPGVDTISFNIAGAAPHTIAPQTALPTISDPVVIDGYTQGNSTPDPADDARPNTDPNGFNGRLLIVLDGINVPAGSDGIRITSGSSTVRGLVINHWVGVLDATGQFVTGGAGIELANVGGNVIEGNFVGADVTGTLALPNDFGIEVAEVASGQISTIGGKTPAARNVISGNNYSGLLLQENNGIGNLVQGNFIGTNLTGTTALPNGEYGLYITADDNNTIGGPEAGSGNLISGNTEDGLALDSGSSGNLIQGNLIGTNITGTAAIANGDDGIDIDGAPNNTIGGTVAGSRNLISGNADDGIDIKSVGSTGNIVLGNLVGTTISGTSGLGNANSGVLIKDGAHGNTVGGTAAGAGNTIAFNHNGMGTAGVVVSGSASQNAILGNSIFANAGLGIDLGGVGGDNANGDGVTANDTTPSQDADTGPNQLQNFPVISYATRDAGNLKLIYKVPSAPANSTYPLRVEFFLADANGQGKTFLGFDTFLDTDFAATAGKTITLTAAAPIKVFDKIVATATDSLSAAVNSPPASTSEFSPGITIASPWQNHFRLRWDVNDDTFVSADDVLAIINYINAKGSGLIPDAAKNEKPYCDVDGDNNVVAADVIEIINYINAGRRLGGEGEAAQIEGVQSSATDDIMAILAADVAAQGTKKRK